MLKALKTKLDPARPRSANEKITKTTAEIGRRNEESLSRLKMRTIVLRRMRGGQSRNRRKTRGRRSRGAMTAIVAPGLTLTRIAIRKRTGRRRKSGRRGMRVIHRLLTTKDHRRDPSPSQRKSQRDDDMIPLPQNLIRSQTLILTHLGGRNRVRNPSRNPGPSRNFNEIHRRIEGTGWMTRNCWVVRMFIERSIGSGCWGMALA